MAVSPSRDPSPAPSSGGDTIDDQADDVKPSMTDLDREDSTADHAQMVGTPSSVRPKREKGSGIKKSKHKKGAHIWINEGPAEGTEDEGAQTPSSRMKKSGSPDADKRTQGTAVGTRRQANGTVGSVYSGSKVRHIKKPDGTPLLRKEIQYEFLRLVIEDDHAVFTRISDGKKNCTFADIYVDCMARSSKTSKILKDRLQVDKQAAHNMAMICLLVNVGRMNTTLNFFPEMRAQLRTYHSIPSLQAYKSQKDYKSLQDAPRLKSILKGASEDTEEPRTLAALNAAPVPRTNPVNLIFVLSQFAPDVAQLHFIDKVDFIDLVIRPTISSASRARAFLWLMWWYLEAPDHDRQNALDNPFGPGEFKEDQDPNDSTQVPQLVPRLTMITEDEGTAENIDPEEEKAFAEKMTRERKRIMAEVASGEFDAKDIEHKGVKRLKKTARDFDDDSDADSARASPGVRGSPAVEGTMGMMIGSMGGSVAGQADSIEDDWEAVDPHPGRGRYKRIKGKNTPVRSKNDGLGKRGGRASGLVFDHGTPDTVGARGTPQPLPPGSANHPIISSFGRGRTEDNSIQPTKSRARTGYQRQLEEHKNSRIQWLLRKKQKDMLKLAQAKREQDGWLNRVALRVYDLDATYDSEDDEEAVGFSFLSNLANPNTTLPIEANTPFTSTYGMGLGGLVARKVLVNPLPQQEDGETQLIDHKAMWSVDAGEEDDYGEEADSWLRILKRSKRRLETWSGEKDHEIYIASKMGKKLPSRRLTSKSKAHALQHMAPAPMPEQAANSASRPNKSYGRGAAAVARRSGAGKRGRIGTPPSSARSRRAEMSLNDEITQDLLAERSDEDEPDLDDEDGDNDPDLDADADGDTMMEDNPHENDEGEDEGDVSDVSMD